MRHDLVHDAGCVFCCEFTRDDLYSDYIMAAVRRGVRIPRSMRKALQR